MRVGRNLTSSVPGLTIVAYEGPFEPQRSDLMLSLTHQSRWGRCKRLLRKLAIASVGLALLIVIVRTGIVLLADYRLDHLENELDRTDPHWRYDDILANSEQIADADNSTLVLMSAAASLPQNWPSTPASHARSREIVYEPSNLLDPLPRRLERLPSNRRLNSRSTKELRLELDALASVLDRARPIVHLPRGYIAVSRKRNHVQIDPPAHAIAAYDIGRLLFCDAVMRIHEGDAAQALDRVRGIINTGRSVAGEPSWYSHLVHLSDNRLALNALERILGHGSIDPKEITATALLLAEEETSLQALLKRSMRYERAELVRMLELLSKGDLDLHDWRNEQKNDWHDRAYAWLYKRPALRFNLVHSLGQMNRLIMTLDLPYQSRLEVIQQLTSELKRTEDDDREASSMAMLLPTMEHVIHYSTRSCAMLRCARVALALEQFRMKNGVWPEHLRDLVPNYLDEIPMDPFRQDFLHMKATDEGLIVYSVGPDGVDDDGNIDADTRWMVGSDLGFRLWLPEKRALTMPESTNPDLHADGPAPRLPMSPPGIPMGRRFQVGSP